MTDSPPRLDALRYTDGKFEPIHDVIGDSDSDLDQALAEHGYEVFFQVGEEQHSQMHIGTYRKRTDTAWTYVMSVWDVSNGGPNIYVDDFADLMDLLSRWSATLQASAWLQLLAELTNYAELSPDGLVERLAARSAYGVDDALAAIRARDSKTRSDRQQREAARRQGAAG